MIQGELSGLTASNQTTKHITNYLMNHNNGKEQNKQASSFRRTHR